MIAIMHSIYSQSVHKVRFLAYWHTIYGGSLSLVSSHRIWGPPEISFFTYYGGLLLPAFFAYYI